MRYSTFFLIVFLLLSLQIAAAQTTFSDEIIIAGQTLYARCVFSADLDGDGDFDVLSASGDDDKIAWYENTDGQGTFGVQNIISTNTDHAQSVFSADIDGDGDNDVVSASWNDDKIAWYENTDGQGTFGPQQIITTSADGAFSVFCSDLDGDGDNDAISASSNDHKIAWYENLDGSGQFGAQQVLSSNALYAISVFSVDLDNDGDNDVLSASLSDDKIAWYENTDGFGTFGPEQIISIDVDGAGAVFAADLDGDGDFDVLSASHYDNKIAWYENIDGLANFGPQQIITVNAGYASTIYCADFDNDGDIDVVSGSYEDNEVCWYENTNGQGSFGPQQIITSDAKGAWSVFCADLDNDGNSDVLSASLNDDKIAWYENSDGQGNFGPQQLITASANEARSVYGADLDGDGDNDVLSASFDDDKIAWYENTDGQGTFGPQQIITTSADGAFSVFSTDLDGDGDNDVLSASEDDDKIAWYENLDGSGTFEIRQSISVGANAAMCVFSIDLDGDEDNDVLSASYIDNKICWYENIDGQGNFGTQQIISTSALDAISVFSTDLDGDGDNDVLSASFADNKIAWYENIHGSGTFSSQRIITTNAIGARAVYSADLDGDSDYDVLSASYSDNKIAWYENIDGQGLFGHQQVITTSAGGAGCVFSADLDGDGDNDVLSASLSDDKIAWYENTDGLGSFGPQQIITTSANGARSVFSIDLDGDGDYDVLSASYYDNKIAWYRNEGPSSSVNIELTYQSGSPVPESGGDLFFNIFAESQLTYPVDFEAWLAVEYEGGAPVTLLFQGFQNYQPGWTINRTNYSYYVPESWAAGNYMMWGRLGFEPDEIRDESGFPFIKSGTNYDADFVPFPVPNAPNPFELTNEKSSNPSGYSLITIHPNPFNPVTVISFELRVASYVELSVYNITGRNVFLSRSGAIPTTGFYGAGSHSFTFDGSKLSSGIYFVRLEAGATVQTKKMVLIK